MPTAVNSATYAAVPIGTVPTTLTINGETRTRAIELMQRRDMYRSVLRSEATLSVMLETALMEQQEKLFQKDIQVGWTFGKKRKGRIPSIVGKFYVIK